MQKVGIVSKGQILKVFVSQVPLPKGTREPQKTFEQGMNDMIRWTVSKIISATVYTMGLGWTGRRGTVSLSKTDATAQEKENSAWIRSWWQIQRNEQCWETFRSCLVVEGVEEFKHGTQMVLLKKRTWKRMIYGGHGEFVSV